jgi:hypothetical protein
MLRPACSFPCFPNELEAFAAISILVKGIVLDPDPVEP